MEQNEERRKDPDLRGLMGGLISAVQDNNVDMGKLLGQTSSAVNRMNVIIVMVTLIVFGLGTQLFLGFTSQEMVRSAKVQLALEAQARVKLESQFKDATKNVEELKRSVKELSVTIQSLPKVTVDDRGRVSLELHADEEVRKTFRTRRGAEKSDTVSIPLNPRQSSY